jgi:Peptidase family C25/FlgD Ig-like domain/CARDB
MRPELRTAVVEFFLCALVPMQSFAIHYSIVSLTSTDAVISFSLDSREIVSPPVQRSFVCAFSSLPDASCTIDVSGRRSSSDAPSPIAHAFLSSGWAGAHYLQWISFSPYLQSSSVKALPTGAIAVHFSSPTIMPGSDSKTVIRNAIALFPLRQSLRKIQAQPLASIPFSIGVKLEVQSDGIYEIRADELRAIGVPVDGIVSKTFRLFCNAIEVPIYITNSQRTTMLSDDKILFYGKFLRGSTTYYTQFSNTNVYWLTWIEGTIGVRISEASGAQQKDYTQYQGQQAQQNQLTARDFYDTIHLEQDNDIRWLGSVDVPGDVSDFGNPVDTIDNWYWGFVGQDYSTDFPVSLPAPSNNINTTAVLRIGLMGLTSITGVAADHNLQVMLNNNPLGDSLKLISWKGQNAFTYTSDPFPVTRLKADQNVVTFLRQSNATDISALNWMEFQYYRSFTALNNKIRFKNSPLDTGDVFQFEITGFTGPPADLWDLTSNRLFTDFEVRRGSNNSQASYSLVFQDSLRSVNSYFAQTADNRLKPSLMRLDTIASQWDTLVNADYIAVSVDSFLPLLKPLADAYKKRGMTVALVDISKVYDAFSSGIHDPESIRSLLRFIFSHASGKVPRYLLLGGDTTHDLDKGARRVRNLVPTHLSRVPGWGPSSDDGYFATVWGTDDFPDLYVGRFPAENKLEMRNLVAKTVSYLTYPFIDSWRDNVLLAGGWDNDFTQFNNQVTSEVIGPAMNISRMDADTGSPYYKNEFTASQTMADYINSGVYALNFNGHGGGNIWSDSRFFGFDDLDKLYNGQWGKGGKLPFVFSFTCLTGFFESAFYRSLGEEFIRQNNSGALCFLGASAYTSKQANLIMNRILLDYAVNAKVESIGELIWLTKMEMLARFKNQYLPIVREYNLLGDPGLPWALAPDSLKLSLSDTSLATRDTLIVRASTLPLKSGQVKISCFADGKKLDESIAAVSPETVNKKIDLKDLLKTKAGLVRGFAWNDSQQLRGWSEFSKNEVPINNVALSKELLHYGDSVTVSCTFAAPDTFSNIALYCLYAIAQQQSPTLNYTGISMAHAGAGAWKSPAITITFSGRTGDILFVKFRISYSAGNARLSDTSQTYSFDIEGCPDLLFTSDTLRPTWQGDSMRVAFEVLNGGNAAAPPFTTVFFLNAGTVLDTLLIVHGMDSLNPGKTRDFNVGIPDIQGTATITATINPGHVFPEISFDNNSKTNVLRVGYRDMKNPSDTLFSPGKGLCIAPAAVLAEKHRVFLFFNPISAVQPLKTESAWVPLRGDSITGFFIGTRPSLSNADSLAWTFFKDTVNLKKRNVSAPSGKMSVLLYDSSLYCWRYASGNRDPQAASGVIRSTWPGPYALGTLADMTPPQVRTSVNGRELIFLDYAAKGKPFNILLNDASGILPSSIKVSLNKLNIDSNSISSVKNISDLNNVSVTAYPKKEYAIDSLSVYAEDLAGNGATTVFAYMPGEDLSIKFFECHPNPFSAKQDGHGATLQTIRFAFELTDVASDVSITIYTIGGRIVWKWDKTGGTIGYQEVEWDGKTTSGYRIANGTYYAKLIAVNDSKKVIKNIRIAKLEGY